VPGTIFWKKHIANINGKCYDFYMTQCQPFAKKHKITVLVGTVFALPPHQLIEKFPHIFLVISAG
jgi:hypothetical protein